MTTQSMSKKTTDPLFGDVTLRDFSAIKASVLDGFLKESASDRTRYTRQELLTLVDKFHRNEIALTENGLVPLNDADLSGLDLRSIDFSIFTLENVILKGARLDRKALTSLLPAAQEGKLRFAGINLEGEDLAGKIVNRAEIGIVSMVRISLEGLDLRGANFKNAQASHIDLDRCDLTGANFEGANLSRALIRNACLINTDMMQADLTEAKLNGSDLRGADLRQAKIRETILTGIIL